MAQKLRASITLAEDLSSILRTHTSKLTVACDSSSSVSACVYERAQTHTLNNSFSTVIKTKYAGKKQLL